jgi:hypothetical protein
MPGAAVPATGEREPMRIDRGPFRFQLACLALVCVVTACSRGDDMERIRGLIREGAALAEKHRIDPMLQLATEDLRAEPGGYDRAGVRDVLALAFLHYGRFEILYPKPAVEVAEDGGSARTSFPFVIAAYGSSLPGLEDLRADPEAWLQAVGDRVDLFRVELRWTRTEERWRVAAVRLETLKRPGFLR